MVVLAVVDSSAVLFWDDVLVDWDEEGANNAVGCRVGGGGGGDVPVVGGNGLLLLLLLLL